MLRVNLTDKIQQPEKQEKLPKAITSDELDEICQAVRDDYEAKRAKGHCKEGNMIWRIPLFRFAFYTGMCASEPARLVWKDIDFERGLVFIRKQKSGKEQAIPLNAAARKVLRGIDPSGRDDYVFRSPFCPSERDVQSEALRMSRAFRKAKERAEIERMLTFHSLRHGFCTRLAEAGKSAVVIREAARHADISIWMIYVHMVNEHLKSELDGVFG